MLLSTATTSPSFTILSNKLETGYMNILWREKLLLLMINKSLRRKTKYSKGLNLPRLPRLHLRLSWLGKRNSMQNTSWKKLLLKRSSKLKFQENNGSLVNTVKLLNHSLRMRKRRLKTTQLKLNESRLKMSSSKDEMIYLSHL